MRFFLPIVDGFMIKSSSKEPIGGEQMGQDYVQLNCAVISVADRQHLPTFTHLLEGVCPDITFLAGGSTHAALTKAGIATTPLSEYTQVPESFGGRIKTIHPQVAGAILYQREAEQVEAERLGIWPIDLVICNLPSCANHSSSLLNSLIEDFDISGSVLIRSAVKNFSHVTVLVDPADYSPLLDELRAHDGSVSLMTRKRLAIKAMNYLVTYDQTMAAELTKRLSHDEPAHLSVAFPQSSHLPPPSPEEWTYSFHEQPIKSSAPPHCPTITHHPDVICAATATHALELLGHSFSTAVVGDGLLCGYATGKDPASAFISAWEGVQASSKQAVVAVNYPITTRLCNLLPSRSIDILAAPEFSREFIDWAAECLPNLHLLELSRGGGISSSSLAKTFSSSIAIDDLFQSDVVTERQPVEISQGLIDFSIAAVTHTQANALAIAHEPAPGQYQLLAITAGVPPQADNFQETLIAQARKQQPNLSRCLLASDASFAFPGIIAPAAEAGLQTIVQPGGSLRDCESIHTANKHNVCMILTAQHSQQNP